MKRRLDAIAYEKEPGVGKPVIFIHGWLGSKEFWKLITPFLDPDNYFLRYDQRCHGESNCSDFNIETLADDLKSLIAELKLNEPILVGHSLGGMTALKYATKYENFSSLCLLGTSANTPDPENKSVRYFLDKFDELDREEWAKKITENYVGESENQEVKEMTRKELKEAEERTVRLGLRAMIEYDLREELKSVEVPSLVIAAEKDGAITMKKSRELADLLDCEIKTVDTSHQMLPEKPAKIGRIIEEFLQTEVK